MTYQGQAKATSPLSATATGGIASTPQHSDYDVVIVGGAMMGASTAWFLSDIDDFDGRVLVVERDTSYSACSTTHTNSCMRQQFSSELNVRISQFAADYVTRLREYMGNDERVPALTIQNFGYLYLADNDDSATVLTQNHAVQKAAGAATRLLNRDQLQIEYPFFELDDIVLASINTVNEGYWDSMTVFDWWRRSARERGVEFIANEVVSMELSAGGDTVTQVLLASGERIGCQQLVNATGPRAAVTSAMAGIELPVEPRKRYTWIFQAETPLDRPLPLTIDPSGFHVRQEGTDYYQAGGHSHVDPAVDFDDFQMDAALWQDEIWPTMAARIPAFEAIRVTNEWAGHYAYNTFDHNAVLGPHNEVGNFHFINGFSGHGLQQSPAMGRGLAELLVFGEYRSMDLTPFAYERIPRNLPFEENAVI